jgi:glycerate dehydrogenase
MMSTKIVFLDKGSIPAHIPYKKVDYPHQWIEYDKTSTEDVVERCIDADIIITNKVVLSAELIAKLPALKHIAVAATGFNNVDTQYCKIHNISVSNTPGYSVTSVPEHTFALIFSLRRHLFAYHNHVMNGGWTQSPHFHGYLSQTFDLKDAQLGIIGGGSLGQATAAMGRALGLKVVFADRKNQKPSSKSTYLPFDELISSSDIISLHCPLTAETENLIALTEFQKMKSNALLINTARGGLVNENDLVTAINEKLIAGAGFDVAINEPITKDNALLSLSGATNFILTPHVAWSSDSSLQCQADMIIENIEFFLAGNSLHLVT